MSPEQLLAEAAKKKNSCIALTDINNTSGILDFFRLAETPFKISKDGEFKVNPVAGIDFRNGAEQKFIGLARNINGFRELNDLLSIHLRNGEPFEDFAPACDDAFIIYPFSSIKRRLRDNEYIGVRFTDLNKLLFSEVKQLHNKLVVLHPVTFLESDMRSNG